jgi:uncharacterized protein DUF4331
MKYSLSDIESLSAQIENLGNLGHQDLDQTMRSSTLRRRCWTERVMTVRRALDLRLSNPLSKKCLAKPYLRLYGLGPETVNCIRNRERQVMADHLDAPGLTSPAMDARVDITDHYAFQKPGDPERTILILNVNPLAPSHADEFRKDALYETLVDTDGDARPNIAFRYRFSPKSDGRQFARVTRAELTGDLEEGHVHEEMETDVLVEHAPVSFGSDVLITEGKSGVRFFAGFRSDPFFFDLVGFLNGFKFTGSDFFIDKNVFGIALDLPNDLLGANPQIGVWARTLVPMTMQPGHLAQADQMGRPAINTVFNHGNDKNIFNVTQPIDQLAALTTSGQTFLQVFTSELEMLGGYSSSQADGIARLLLPDILTFDFSSSAGFLNGRQLRDDVIDISLNLVTNGKITGDGVGPHTDYLSDFPYLGSPHV